jgi:uncharacterized membrane protein
MVDITIRKEGSSDNERAKAAAAYLLGFISGIVILFISDRSEHIKFHAWQSMIISLLIGGIVSVLLMLILQGDFLIAALTMWLVAIFIYLWYIAYLTYHGIRFKIPVLSGLIRKYIVK